MDTADGQAGAQAEAIQPQLSGDLLQIQTTMLQAVEKLDRKIEDRFQSLSTDIGTKFNALQQKTDEIEKSLDFQHDEVATMKKEVSELKKDCCKLKNDLIKMQTEKETLAKTLMESKRQPEEGLNSLERYSRNFNIRILGVKEMITAGGSQRNHWNQLVAQILMEQGVADSDNPEEVENMIENSHPIGKNRDQLIAKFYSRPERNTVLRKAKAIYKRQDGERPSIRIVEDFTGPDFALRQKALPLMQAAYTEGHKVRFSNGKLYINGKEKNIP